MILPRRISAEAPRPILRGPSWEAPVLRIHSKYAVILARRRLKKGRRPLKRGRRQGRPNRPRGVLGGGTPRRGPPPLAAQERFLGASSLRPFDLDTFSRDAVNMQ